MGCEPRGFGWSAAVEVCSARVTRLVTDLKNFEKFSTRQLVPSTGAWHLTRGRDLPAFRFGDRKGAWHRARGRDLPAFRFGDRKGARHRARGRDLPAFRFGDRKGAWHRAQGRDLPAFRLGSQRCLAPGAGARFASIPIRGSAKVPGTGGGGEICQHSDWDRKGAWHEWHSARMALQRRIWRTNSSGFKAEKHATSQFERMY